jgi:thymidylate kinase
MAYQGGGRELPSKLTSELISIAPAELNPEITFVIHLPPEKNRSSHLLQAARILAGCR